ncbi:MAG: DUF4962 domain-containing protein, partial [Armatimonadetes bacterium]|nr:DUF4962 domain-containing protein [Armatimonadota bacterium]
MRSEYYHRFTGGVVGALLLALCATDARGMENNMLDAIRRVQPGPHPYLFFQAGDLPELRAKMTVSPTREMWERIRSYADRLIAEPFAPPEGAAYVRFTREAAGQIRGLALAYVLGGDERHADRAIQEVEWLLGREAWVENPPRRDRKPGYAPDRVTATSGYAVAQVYDMLYDRLTPEQRQRIRQAVLEKSIKPIVNRGGSDASTYWLKWYTGNWADAAYGEIGVAAMAFLGEEPGAADIVAFAAENVQRALEAACRDGGWGEGLLYYSVAWGTPTYFLHRLRKLTHGEVDLTDHPFLKNTHLFPLYFLMPGRATYARIGNCSTGPPHSAHLLAILAAEYQNAHAQWLANLGVGNLAPAQWIAGYTRYDRNLEAKPPLDLPKAKLFRGVNWAAFRSGWDNPDDVFFTFKGGHGNWDHIHGDFNSFTLNAYGAELLVD